MPEDVKNSIKQMDDIYDDDEKETRAEVSRTEELANSIVETAKLTGNEVTYAEINAMLSDVTPDKETLEEIYDLVESRNISIIESREPTSIELEDDDVDDDEILEMEMEGDDIINDEEDEKKSGVVMKS